MLNKIEIVDNKLQFIGFPLLQNKDVLFRKSISGKVMLKPVDDALPGLYFRLTDEDLSSVELIEYFQDANAIDCPFAEIRGLYYQC